MSLLVILYNTYGLLVSPPKTQVSKQQTLCLKLFWFVKTGLLLSSETNKNLLAKGISEACLRPKD